MGRCHDCVVCCAGSVLERCAGEPKVVCGGGCVDSAIAHFVRERARSLGEERSASSESPPVEPEHCAGERKAVCCRQ